jgi:hypothetical protein
MIEDFVVRGKLWWWWQARGIMGSWWKDEDKEFGLIWSGKKIATDAAITDEAFLNEVATKTDGFSGRQMAKVGDGVVVMFIMVIMMMMVMMFGENNLRRVGKGCHLICLVRMSTHGSLQSLLACLMRWNEMKLNSIPKKSSSLVQLAIAMQAAVFGSGTNTLTKGMADTVLNWKVRRKA